MPVNRNFRYPIDDLVTTPNQTLTNISDSLRKTFKKFTKAQLYNEVLQVGGLSQLFPRNHQKRMDKKKTVEYLIRLTKQIDTNENKWISTLELRRCQLSTKNRMWMVFAVENAEFNISSNPDMFGEALESLMNRSNLTCDVISELKEDVIWTIISIYTAKKTDTIFLVTYPELPIIIHTTFKKAYQKLIYRAIVRLYKGNKYEELAMKSKNIETLLHYSIQEFNLNSDNVPIQQVVRERRGPELDENPNIVWMDEDDDNAKDEYVKVAFGEYKLPVIQSLTYNVRTSFCGFDEKQDLPPVTCQVVFKGSDVLEGMVNFIETGIADHPLPDHILKIPEYPDNVIELIENDLESDDSS